MLDAYRHCDGVWEDQEEKEAIKDVMDELLTNDNVGEADKGTAGLNASLCRLCGGAVDATKKSAGPKPTRSPGL